MCLRGRGSPPVHHHSPSSSSSSSSPPHGSVSSGCSPLFASCTQPAPSIQLTGCGREAHRELVEMATAAGPAHARPIFICRRQRERARAPLLPAHLLRLRLFIFLPLSKAIYEPLPLSPPPASLSILSGEGVQRKNRKNKKKKAPWIPDEFHAL